MSLLCRWLGHRRSVKQARRAGDRWVSRCTFCGEPLVRRGPKAWQLASLYQPDRSSEVPLPLFED